MLRLNQDVFSILVGFSSFGGRENNGEIYQLESRTFFRGIPKKQGIFNLWKIYPLTILENATTATVTCRNAYDDNLRRLYQNDLNATKSKNLHKR